jgi:hypothetical protein
MIIRKGVTGLRPMVTVFGKASIPRASYGAEKYVRRPPQGVTKREVSQGSCEPTPDVTPDNTAGKFETQMWGLPSAGTGVRRLVLWGLWGRA